MIRQGLRAENFPNGSTDASYDNYRQSPTAPIAPNPQPKSGTVGGNSYFDDIASFPAWVTYYEGVLSGIGTSSSWSFVQNVTYNGTQLVQHNDGITIMPNNDYATFRGGCSVDGNTGGANGCG